MKDFLPYVSGLGTWRPNLTKVELSVEDCTRPHGVKILPVITKKAAKLTYMPMKEST